MALARWWSTVVSLLAGSCATLDPNDWKAWLPQPSGVEASLRGVCAVSAEVCWASGSRGTVLRTVDGGRTWEARPVPGGGELDFRDVQAWDGDRALVLSAGAPAHLFQTMDGGRTWRQTYSDARDGIFFDGFAFWNERSGLAVSDPVAGSFVVLRTDDGGTTWREVPAASLPAAIRGEAAFAASGTCVATSGEEHACIGTGGRAARVLRTDDRGRTWSAHDTPLARGQASQGVFSLAFRDPDRGVAVGGDYQTTESTYGLCARTRDGGRTWQAARRPPGGYRSCVAWVPGRDRPTFVAVGPGGIDVSFDDGATWQPVSATGYHAVAFTPAGDAGWAVGADGRVARLAVR